MEDTFLNVYPKLSVAESGQSFNLTGLWLAHGDEPLLQQWLVPAGGASGAMVDQKGGSQKVEQLRPRSVRGPVRV